MFMTIKGCLFLISCVFTYLGTGVDIAEAAWFYFKDFVSVRPNAC